MWSLAPSEVDIGNRIFAILTGLINMISLSFFLEYSVTMRLSKFPSSWAYRLHEGNYIYPTISTSGLYSLKLPHPCGLFSAILRCSSAKYRRGYSPSSRLVLRKNSSQICRDFRLYRPLAMEPSMLFYLLVFISLYIISS